MPRFQRTRRLISTNVLGTNLATGLLAQNGTKVDLGNLIAPFLSVGFKSLLVALEFKVVFTWTMPAAQPAIPARYFKYLLNKRMVGPGNYVITEDRRGWHDYLWNFMQRGRVEGIRGADIAANATAGTRTFTSFVDFEEPFSQAPLARCYLVEALKAANAGLWLSLATTPVIKGAALTVTAATVYTYAHVVDVPITQLPIPTPVSEYALQTNNGDVNPTPGIGKFLRIMMANSPIYTDNLDQVYGGSSPWNADDLSPYSSLDYFGYAANYPVFQEAVDTYTQKVMTDVAAEQHTQLSSQAGNHSLFRILDPQENSDGLTLALPLVYPSKGTDYMRVAPTFNDFPRLGANGNSRAGLPAGFFYLCQRIDARTDAMLNAYVAALTDPSGKSLLGRTATPVGPGDQSRIPLVINGR